MITADSVSPKASFKRALLPVCIVIKAPTRRASAKKTHERFIASPVYTEPLGMVADSRRAWLSLHRYWRVSDIAHLTLSRGKIKRQQSRIRSTGRFGESAVQEGRPLGQPAQPSANVSGAF
jgi:hypothetical protein